MHNGRKNSTGVCVAAFRLWVWLVSKKNVWTPYRLYDCSKRALNRYKGKKCCWTDTDDLSQIMRLTPASRPKTSGLMFWQSESSCVSVLWTTEAEWHLTDCTKCSGAEYTIYLHSIFTYIWQQLIISRDHNIIDAGHWFFKHYGSRVCTITKSLFYFLVLDSQRRVLEKAVTSPSVFTATGLSRVRCVWDGTLWSSPRTEAVRALVCSLKASFRPSALKLSSYPSHPLTSTPISFCPAPITFHVQWSQELFHVSSFFSQMCEHVNTGSDVLVFMRCSESVCP